MRSEGIGSSWKDLMVMDSRFRGNDKRGGNDKVQQMYSECVVGFDEIDENNGDGGDNGKGVTP